MENRPKRTNRNANKSLKNVNFLTGRTKEISNISCCHRHHSGKKETLKHTLKSFLANVLKPV